MFDYHYKILQISEFSSKEEITKAYRRLAQKYHPDKNKDKNATSKFIEIKESYEFIIKNFDNKSTPVDTFTKTTYDHRTINLNINVSFYASFSNSKYFLHDYNVWITIPPVLHNQSLAININTSYGPRKANIFVTLYDPNGFYKICQIKDKFYLYCDLNVSVSRLLSADKISLVNINPALPNIEYYLDLKDKKDQIEIPHAGLRNNNGIRDKLIINIKIDYINLQNEQFHILLKLKENLDNTLSKYKTSLEK